MAGLLWVPFWLWWTRKAIRPVTSGFDGANLDLKVWRSAIHDRRILSYIGCRFFGDSSGYFFLFWLPEYLMSSKGFSFVRLGELGWIPFCFTDFGAVIGGYTSGRLIGTGVAPILTRKILMTMAACLVIGGIALQNRLGPIFALSVSAFGVGVWAANLHALAADGFHGEIVARVHGIAGSAGAIGGIILNSIVGCFVSTRNNLPLFISLALLEPSA
jgi:ACS family hexuronate transporter-like MFS transporter